jgi:hypothetical protein
MTAIERRESPEQGEGLVQCSTLKIRILLNLEPGTLNPVPYVIKRARYACASFAGPMDGGGMRSERMLKARPAAINAIIPPAKNAY